MVAIGGTLTFWQRGLWDSCFQNPNESSAFFENYIVKPFSFLLISLTKNGIP